MQYLSVNQVSDMSGLSEKTIRRHIQAGKLPAERLPNGRLVIDADDVPARVPVGRDLQIAELSMQLAQLRDQVKRLEARLARHEVTGHASVSSVAPTASYEAREASMKTFVATSSPTSNLPDGLVSLNAFCEQHGITISSVKSAIKRGDVQCHRGLWRVGAARVEYALDEQERATILERYGM